MMPWRGGTAIGPRASRSVAPRLMASAADPEAEGVIGVQEPLARRMLPRVDRREIAAIFAGGALGPLARAALAAALPHPATAWPRAPVRVHTPAPLPAGSLVAPLRPQVAP